MIKVGKLHINPAAVACIRLVGPAEKPPHGPRGVAAYIWLPGSDQPFTIDRGVSGLADLLAALGIPPTALNP